MLYKYQPFDRKRLTSIFIDSELWLSSPLTFNDPFDCSPIIDVAGTAREYREMAWSAIQRQRRGWSRAERRRELAAFAKQRNERFSEAAGRSNWIDTVANLGVLCLTEIPDDLLMWGHYAASHRGICLGFDTRYKPFILAMRVHYSSDRPVFRPLERRRTEKHEMVWSAVTRKAAQWQYEREWRVLASNRTGALAFSPKALRVAILGAHVDADDRAWLANVIQARGGDLELMQCRLDGRLYRLGLDRL